MVYRHPGYDMRNLSEKYWIVASHNHKKYLIDFPHNILFAFPTCSFAIFGWKAQSDLFLEITHHRHQKLGKLYLLMGVWFERKIPNFTEAVKIWLELATSMPLGSITRKYCLSRLWSDWMKFKKTLIIPKVLIFKPMGRATRWKLMIDISGMIVHR